jgi:hypothetical protein
VIKIPFGKYKDFADCVSQNQDKKSPEGYCAVVHKKITGKYPSEKNSVSKSEYKRACIEMLSESFKETYSPEQLASKAQAVYISTTVGGHALDKKMEELDLDNHKEYEYVINQKLNGKYVGVLFLLTPLAVARWVQTGGMSGFSRTSVADLKKDKYELWESLKEAQKTKSQQFKIINDNQVKLQNWRNDRVTYYSKRGYTPAEVIDFIDGELLPSVKKYTPDYTDAVLDMTIPVVDSGLLTSLNTKLSVKFPPQRKESVGDWEKTPTTWWDEYQSKTNPKVIVHIAEDENIYSPNEGMWYFSHSRLPRKWFKTEKEAKDYLMNYLKTKKESLKEQKKFKVAKSDPRGGHAGGQAVAMFDDFDLALKDAKKRGKDFAVYVYREPYGWGYVQGVESFKEQGLGVGWKKVKETPKEIRWVRQDEKSNIVAYEKEEGGWVVKISVPSGASRTFDAKDMSQAKRIAGAETHRYDMVLKNRIERLRFSLKEAVFDVAGADQLVNKLKSGIKAPYVSAYKSTLGGADRVSVMLTISLDKKDDWENGILQNSNYGNFSIDNDGVIEHFSGSMKPYMRKTRFKNPDEVVQKINQYLGTVKR